MRKYNKQQQNGFTIIEVLIVLAIAGLIMLVVFLAVPALQRNSRNEGRRSDAGRIAAAINDWVANNNGTLPTEANMATIMSNVGNTAQYTITGTGTLDRAANVASTGGTVAVLGNTANRPMFRLVTSAKCGINGTADSASSRQAALQYQLETPNGNSHTNACLDI